MKRTIKSFTLIELLVVIVIIGILAGVIIVSTTSSINSAKNAKMIAELSNLSKSFEGYSHYYVGSLCIEDTVNNPNFLSYYGLTTVPKHDGYVAGQTALTTNNCYLYFSDGKEYSIRTPSVGNKGYLIQESRTQKTQDLQTSCDAGWIPFGNRCIMKYEAKCTEYPDGGSCIEGTSTLRSQSAGTPWVNITQDQAQAECQKIGAHLITNAEWMSLARDIEQVKENWSNGSVGSGLINRGFTNGSNTAPAANTGTSYLYNTGVNTLGSSGSYEYKRTHKLSNGQEIWDFSGNVHEWVDEAIPSQKNMEPPQTTFVFNEIINVTNWGNTSLSYSEVGPKNNILTRTNGVGSILYNSDDNTIRIFRRGGAWNYGTYAGVFALDLNSSPSTSSGSIGFRCAR